MPDYFLRLYTEDLIKAGHQFHYAGADNDTPEERVVDALLEHFKNTARPFVKKIEFSAPLPQQEEGAVSNTVE